jgi:HEAT repeat protein
MTPSDPEQQLIRLASDNASIYQDAWRWFLTQGPAIAPVLIAGLQDSELGSVGHWRILLVLRELALPSTLPAILNSFRRALARKDPIVLPGAMEALAAFDTEQEALSALISVLQSGEIDDIVHGAALLGNIASDRVVQPLINLLSHPQPAVRRSAVQALQKINSAPAQAALKLHRNHEKDPNVLALVSSKP